MTETKWLLRARSLSPPIRELVETLDGVTSQMRITPATDQYLEMTRVFLIDSLEDETEFLQVLAFATEFGSLEEIMQAVEELDSFLVRQTAAAAELARELGLAD